MGGPAHETPLQRRLRELEEEEKALRHNMKLLERQARALAAEAAETPRSTPRVGPKIASTVPRPGLAAEEAQADAGPLPAPVDQETAEPAAAVPPRAAPAQRPAARSDERFANYFASGSFGRARPLGHERRLQRNKAIFMVVFVALVGYVMYRVLFK